MSDDKSNPHSATPGSLTTVSSTGTSLSTIHFNLTGHPVVLRKFERPSQDHAIYALVGQVASAWAHLEHTLDLVISELASIPAEKMACVTAQLMGVWPRYNSIIALLAQRSISEPAFAKHLKSVRSLSGRSRDASEKRNRIIHDPWYVESGADQTAQFKSMAKDDLRYGIKDVDQQAINETLDAIKSLSDEAGKLRSAILDELHPLRKIRTAKRPEDERG